MSNKVVLLTTATPHHLYFAWQLSVRFKWAGILVETDVLKAPFDTFHPLEKERDEFEERTLLKEGPQQFKDLAETFETSSSNNARAHATLKTWSPDWMVVFGTGLLKPETYQLAHSGALNLHGGDPERYRGLDSHYWALYHRDFDSLVTTLHQVDDQFDTGAIVGKKKLDLNAAVPLSQLRSVNTRACVDLVCDALEKIHAGAPLEMQPQKTKGRYYSFMPAALKDICVRNYKDHIGIS